MLGISFFFVGLLGCNGVGTVRTGRGKKTGKLEANRKKTGSKPKDNWKLKADWIDQSALNPKDLRWRQDFYEIVGLGDLLCEDYKL